MVARRKIFEMKIDKRIKDDRIEDAKKLLEDLRQVPTYDAINERLSEIQQQILKVDKGPLSSNAKSKIDVMIDTTRQMMQKYLQVNLVRQFESQLEGK